MASVVLAQADAFSLFVFAPVIGAPAGAMALNVEGTGGTLHGAASLLIHA